MTVNFIGAGPGAPDLITVRGRDIIARCPVCLYAGSIVPKDLLAYCPDGARLVDTAPLSLDEIEAEYFLRFRVKDVPGVLAKISGILGDHSISIESMIQRGRDDNGKGVPLVMMTHRSNEKNVQDALIEIDRLDVVCEKSNLIRVEN